MLHNLNKNNMQQEKLKEYLKGKIIYNPEDLLIHTRDQQGFNKICKVESWVQMRVSCNSGTETDALTDELGRFIAEAIQEKIDKEFN
jgi:hypothetical protein